MQSKHDRKLVFGGVDLVGASLENDLRIYKEIREYLQPIMIESGYLEGSPFLWIGIIFRYGLKNETAPHYKRISQKYGDLSLAMELDMRILLTAEETDLKLLREFFEIAALDCLIHVGKKYKRPTEVFETMRDQFGKIPDWEYDMEEHPEIMLKRYQQSKTIKKLKVISSKQD